MCWTECEVLKWGLQLDGRGSSSTLLACAVFQPNGCLLAASESVLERPKDLVILNPGGSSLQCTAEVMMIVQGRSLLCASPQHSTD